MGKRLSYQDIVTEAQAHIEAATAALDRHGKVAHGVCDCGRPLTEAVTPDLQLCVVGGRWYEWRRQWSQQLAQLNAAQVSPQVVQDLGRSAGHGW